MLKTPPRTLLEVYNSLPEGTLAGLVNNSLVWRLRRITIIRM